MRPSPDQPIRVTAKIASVVRHIAAVLSLGAPVAIGVARVASRNAAGAYHFVAVASCEAAVVSCEAAVVSCEAAVVSCKAAVVSCEASVVLANAAVA